jgi:hypothetical protein
LFENFIGTTRVPLLLLLKRFYIYSNLTTVASWPNFRPNKSLLAPKKFFEPEKIYGQKMKNFAQRWQKRYRKKQFKGEIHSHAVISSFLNQYMHKIRDSRTISSKSF